MATKRIRQIALRPGTYRISGGREITLTPGDLRRYATGTRRLIKGGKRGVSVYLEHPDPEDDASLPQSAHDLKARRVKNAVGWVTDIGVEKDGSLAYEMDVVDPDVAAKMEDGRIRFTSPHLEREWTDPETGEKYNGLIPHVALTNQPRSADQGEFQPAGEAAAVQFSMADYVGPPRRGRPPKAKPAAGGKNAKAAKLVRSILAQFADDDDESQSGKSSKSGDESADSDDGAPVDDEALGDTGGGADGDEESSDDVAPADVKRALEALDKRGIALPADTTLANFFDRLVAACTAIEGAEAADSATDPESQYMPAHQATEEQPYRQQFSVADVRGRRRGVDAVLAKLIGQTADAMEAQIAGLARAHVITPAVAEKLRKQFGGVQFSTEGDERPSFTLADVLQLLTDNAKGLSRFAGAQFGGAVEADHPNDRFWDEDEGNGQGPAPGSESQKRLIAKQLGQKAAAGK